MDVYDVGGQRSLETILTERAKPSVRVTEKLTIILIALCPILQHYKGIYINAAVSVLLLLLPYAFSTLVMKRYIDCSLVPLVLPLAVNFLFQVVDHGTSVTEAGQAAVFIFYVIVLAAGGLSTTFFIRAITVVSVVASVCIIIQYFCYYILHFHLQVVPTSLLLPRANQWVLLAQTGRYSITGKMIKFYRPSAFFLEPSHMFIYTFTPSTLRVLTAETKREKLVSAILVLGLILTTSGMGILCGLMLIVLYLGKAGKAKRLAPIIRKLLQPKNIGLLLAFLILFVVAYFRVPFIHNSVERILFSGTDFTTAVSGRLNSGWNVIKAMRGKQLLIGVKDGLSGITASMSAFNETMYQYGIIGVILSYIFYACGLLKLKREFFWVALVVIALSFFSQHTHSTMFIIYEVFVFLEGYRSQRIKPRWRMARSRP